MPKLARYIFIIFLLISLTAQADTNKAASKVVAYTKKDFIEKFGNSYVEGDIVKVSQFTSHMGSFFMMLTIDTTPSNHPYQKVTDDPNNRSTYAYGFVEDHGGLKQIWAFKDFNTRIYKPRFYINETGMMDGNADGNPEFIVAYFGASDQKAQPLRILSYFNGLRYTAEKIYPVSKKGKVQIEYDPNWKRLPKPTQSHVNKLLKSLKPFDFYDFDNTLKLDTPK